MKYFYLGILLLFLTACAVLEVQKQKAPTNVHPLSQAQKTKEPVKTEVVPEPIVTKCETAVISATDTRGKIVLYYDNGQKESLSDYCGEGGFGFRIQYYCEGTEAKTRNTKCSGNSTCSKGTCI